MISKIIFNDFESSSIQIFFFHKKENEDTVFQYYEQWIKESAESPLMEYWDDLKSRKLILDIALYQNYNFALHLFDEFQMNLFIREMNKNNIKLKTSTLYYHEELKDSPRSFSNFDIIDCGIDFLDLKIKKTFNEWIIEKNIGYELNDSEINVISYSLY